MSIDATASEPEGKLLVRCTRYLRRRLQDFGARAKSNLFSEFSNQPYGHGQRIDTNCQLDLRNRGSAQDKRGACARPSGQVNETSAPSARFRVCAHEREDSFANPSEFGRFSCSITAHSANPSASGSDPRIEAVRQLDEHNPDLLRPLIEGAKGNASRMPMPKERF